MGDESAAPGDSQILALLFTDVAGSTRLWERHPAQMKQAVAAHDALSREAVRRHRGQVVKMVGDGLYAVFEDPLDGLQALIDLQLSLLDTQKTAGLELRIRSGLHVGPVEARDDDYFGPSVNRAARLMSVGHGQQMLLSQTAALLVRDRLPPGTSLQDLGTLRLRDLEHTEQVHQLNHPRLPATFPPLKGLDATPGNLPRPLTRLIGRTKDLDGISTALARNRLLTLLGPGGIGKTRLAVAWAQAHGHTLTDGAWFLGLTSVSDPALLMQSLASVLA
ncbi:MAG: adenylate/guanylate cyclase domain-containing protein, partial [Rubrivivax sp.]